VTSLSGTHRDTSSTFSSSELMRASNAVCGQIIAMSDGDGDHSCTYKRDMRDCNKCVCYFE
jgi:hypothetical protein